VAGPIVSLNSVSLTLDSRAGPVAILNGVGLDIERGQSVAIVGPSGSGKTSLLMILAGLERATSGEVTIAGHDFQALGEDALARVRGETIGIVFQSFHLVPTMTALENVALPLEFSGRANAEDVARARLDEVGLSHRLDHYPRTLSGGEQQRVAIARAIVTDPDLIVADEPTGDLDARNAEATLGLLRQLKNEFGKTIVMVTHDPRALRFVDDAFHLDKGILLEGADADRAEAALLLAAGGHPTAAVGPAAS